VGQAHFDASEQWAHCGPVSGKVGQVPGDQWAGRNRRFETSDEWVTVDGLNHLIRWLPQNVHSPNP